MPCGKDQSERLPKYTKIYNLDAYITYPPAYLVQMMQASIIMMIISIRHPAPDATATMFTSSSKKFSNEESIISSVTKQDNCSRLCACGHMCACW